MSARLSVIGIALASVIAGCAPGPRTARWSIEFATPDLRARTAVVVARALAGGCAGGVVHEVRIERASGGTMQLTSPLLGPGTFGFEAFALDADCAWVASDCREVTLPLDGAITLFLRDETTAPRCPAAICAPGRCLSADAGVDASSFDAGARDAADAGARDAPGLDAPGLDASDAARSPDAAICTSTTPSVTGASSSVGFLSAVTATGSTITIRDLAGETATLTLSGGVTASGSASPVCPDSGSCFPILTGVSASGDTITFFDQAGATFPITLVGATASGSFTMAETGGGALSATVTTSGRRITFSTWVFSGPAMMGDIVLAPTEICR